MKKVDKLMKFENFILEESTQRNAAIATAVSRIKEEFGNTKEKFLEYAKKRGFDEIKDFIVKTIEPYVDRIEGQEKLQNGRLSFDYDDLLSGLISWLLVEIEFDRMKKDIK